MKNSLVNKLDPIIAFLVFILFFLAKKEVYPNLVYFICAIIVALYFFPVKFFTPYWKNEIRNDLTTIYFLSYFLISFIIALSVVLLYYQGSKTFYYIMVVASIINILLAYFYFLKKYPSYLFVIHFSVSFVTATAIIA